MTLDTQLCIVLFGTYLLCIPLLLECKKLNDCTFPIYLTKQCPRNQTEWNKRSSEMNCSNTNEYMCLPDERFEELFEFCYDNPRLLVVQESCLLFNRRYADLEVYSCRNFDYGCPSNHYLSSEIYKYQSCIHVENGCFVAEPSCKSQSSQRENQINDSAVAISLGVYIPTLLLCILFFFFIRARKSRSDMKKKRDLLKRLIDDSTDFGYRYCDAMETNKGM